MRFRPLSKTVVTEIRSFLVDSVSKIGLHRQAVSAPVDLTKELSDKDINISKTQTYEFKDASVLLAISSPEPIKAIFTGSKPIIIDPEVPVDPETNITAIVTCAQEIKAGNSIGITVEDDDAVSYASVGVVIYNENTGETEHAELLRQPDGKYQGYIVTLNDKEQGTNFDRILNCYYGHKIQVIYSDPRTANNIRENVTRTINVLSPTETAVIETREFVSIGKPIPIIIKDKDITAPSVPVVVRNLGTGQSIVVDAMLAEAGTYKVSVPTAVFTSFFADNTISALIGHTVEVIYIDDNDIWGETSSITKTINIVGAVNEIGSFVLPETIKVNTYVDIRLKEYDLVGMQAAVTVSNVATDEYEVVILSETILGSGEFVGRLFISDTTTGSSMDNELLVEEGSVLKFLYVDNIGNVPTTIEKLLTVYSTPVIEEPEEPVDPEEPEEPEEPETNDGKGTVEFLINGSFFLNGRFEGTIKLEGLNTELTRCKVIIS